MLVLTLIAHLFSASSCSGNQDFKQVMFESKNELVITQNIEGCDVTSSYEVTNWRSDRVEAKFKTRLREVRSAGCVQNVSVSPRYRNAAVITKEKGQYRLQIADGINNQFSTCINLK